MAYRYKKVGKNYKCPTNNNQRRVLYHRWLMEKHLGRCLEANESVHFIDGDNTNFAIDNLDLWVNGRSTHYEALVSKCKQ